MMAAPTGDPLEPIDRRSAGQLLNDLREANEKLVLASITSHELKDRAEAAQAVEEQAAQALRDSQGELLANAQFREQLLAVVGHDLRNPLSAIGLSTRLMQDHDQLTAEDARRAEMILKCVGRMERMIEHVLDFTRLRVGSGLSIEVGPADLRAVCQQAIAELAVHPDVQIHAEFDDDLTGLWDGERLTQVVSNILGNAVDHATINTPILLSARGADEEVLIEIINQGAPIPEELLPVLFAPFRQGRENAVGHLGLGLYIAKEIVASHLGTLVARSASGRTTFSLRLPRTLTAGGYAGARHL